MTDPTDRTPPAGAEGIAVVGMAGRFPGARDLDELWRNLCGGVESITFWSREELEAAGVDTAQLSDPRYVPAAGVLWDIDRFDAAFFGFSPREAEVLDPQHRLFLECAWEALENAGYDTESYGGSIGVFGGMGMTYYLFHNLLSNPEVVAASGSLQLRILNDKDFLVSAAAFKLNLTGPSVTVQTACSTSLVATCLACQSLLNFQCDAALAGGVNVAVPHTAGYLTVHSVFSPDGHCRAFDAEAQGTVGGSGGGVVVLKRLSDAIADGDTIHAVIKGFALNNDGSFKVGYTAPSVDGQLEVVAMAQAMAGVAPETITYVETHGTGTPMGDPIEVEALSEVFTAGTDRKGFCGLGSIKTNIGHLDAAAGIASLLKTVLATEHGVLPASLNFRSPNPRIDFADSPFYVNAETHAWTPPAGVPRRAGVSAFSMGGVNAHVIVEEPPPPKLSSPALPWHLLVLSARTETALETMTDNLVRHLFDHPELDGDALADVAFTLQVGRRAFEHRRILVCRDREDAIAALKSRDPRRVLTGTVRSDLEPSQPMPGFNPEEDRASQLQVLGRLWLAGHRVDWSLASDPRTRRPLPTYPFERRRYWIDPPGRPAQPKEPSEPGRPQVPPLRARLHPRPKLPVSFVPPRDDLETGVASAFSSLLRVQEVGIYDSFFDLGGDSLLATRLIAHLGDRYGVELSLRALFETPTSAELAATIAARSDEAPASARIEPRPRDGPPLPLSFAQSRLWLLHQLDPESPAYNVPAAVRMTGRLDLRALHGSFAAVVARHEALRTTFLLSEGEPLQRIHPADAVPLPLVDLSRLSDPEEEARRLAAAEMARPFDLESGPLVRATLLRLAPEEHVALFTMHHIVSDGWSTSILTDELAALYSGSSPLPPLPIQYADFAAWQREWLSGDILESQLGYWRERLAGAPPVLDLPGDRPPPSVPSGRGGMVEGRLSPGLAASVESLARSLGVTPYMALLAAWKTQLYRMTGQTDLLVGTPIANRNRAEIEALIGCFVNTLVLRTGVAGEMAFETLVETVREVSLSGYAHQDLPFERIVEELAPERSLAHSPLFQVMFVLHNTPAAALELPGLRLSPFDLVGVSAKFDLSLGLVEASDGSGAFLTNLEFSRDRFDTATAIRLLGYFEILLASAVGDPKRRIEDLPWMSEPERVQILAEWSGLSEQEEWGDAGPCVHDQVLDWGRTGPGSLAVDGGEGRLALTYGELCERADRLARHLVRLGVKPEIPVGVMLERSAELLTALLGVWQAGGAYVPLDPDLPRERLLFQMEDSGALVLVTEERYRERCSGTAAAVVVILGDYEEAAAAPAVQVLPGNLAYIIYTSGSTGQPKGASVEHGSLRRLIDVYGRFHRVTAADRATLVAAPGFDAAVLEIWPHLVAGASLHVVPEEVRGDPAALLAWLARERITLTFLPTPLAELVLAEAEWPQNLALRALLTGGDRLRRRPPVGFPVPVLNEYGPTETTVSVIADWVEPEGAAAGMPSIGRPTVTAAAYVLDRCLRPVPIGIPGELCIGGGAVARGYFGRPAGTAERFVPDPWSGRPGARMYRSGDLARYLPDGRLDFLGRLDRQVKIRGFRIELGEVEAAMAAHPEVAEAAVLLDAGGRLAAFMAPREPGAPDLPARLHRFLRDRLPEAMVPLAFVVLERLPLTPNGKVDREALAGMAGAGMAVKERSEYAAPRGPVEEGIAALWAEVLGLGRERIGIHDDFFSLGGHSLLATRVVSRLRSAFGVELGLRSLFEAPTVAGFAAAVQSALQTGAGAVAEVPPIVPMPRNPAGEPLSSAQRRLWFLDQLEPGNPAYNVPVALTLSRALDPAALAAALTAVVDRHEALRTTFGMDSEGEPIQKIGPAGSAVPLPRIDLAGLADPEPEARRLAAEEAVRSFDLERGPLLRVTLLRLEGVSKANQELRAGPPPGDQSPGYGVERPMNGAFKPDSSGASPSPGIDARAVAAFRDTRLQSERHAALLTMHHIVSDGWSMGVLVREIAELYRAAAFGAEPGLEPLPVQYADYAVWQREWLQGEVLGAQLAFWRQRLAGAPPALELPADRPRPLVPSGRGGSREASLPHGLHGAATATGRTAGATLFMALLAAFAALLHRYTGAVDLVVGTPIANRTRDETTGLIGFFVNTLALRADLAGSPSFLDLLGRIREMSLAAYAHQDLPFERLVEDLAPERSLSRTPLFQVMFGLQNAPLGPIELPGLSIAPFPVEGRTAKFDLTLLLGEDGGALGAQCEYASDLFDGTTAERLLGHFQVLLAAAAADPEQPVEELPLLTETERRELLAEEPWADIEDQPVHEWFSAQAAWTPEAIALESGDLTLTYADIDRRSDALAGRLLEQGLAPEEVVAVRLERGWEQPVALLAVLKAGGCYLPLDPAWPAERLAYMLEDARASVFVTQDSFNVWEGLVPSRAGRAKVDLDHLAWITYTSGSTGRPKGIGFPHRALFRLISWQVGASAAPLGRTLQLASASFDVSPQETFAAWCAGGTLVLAAEEDRRDSETLLRTLRQRRIERIFLPYVALQQLADLAAGDPPPSLLEVVAAGEPLHITPEIETFFAALPNCALRNQYGPSETHIVTQHHLSGEPKSWPALPPIGRAIPGSPVRVLDRGLHLLPAGVPGELCIGGRQMARGYHGRPDVAAERFVPDPWGPPGSRLYRTGDLARRRPDGDLDFLGRIDQQVKVRGFRVEPGEIETVLSLHPWVREAAVVARGEGVDRYLVAFVKIGEPRPEPAELRDTLRSHLAAHLPEALIPAVFVGIETFPLTPSGKVNRKALAAMDLGGQGRSSSDPSPPRTPVEEALAEIWAGFLPSRERIGIHDDFFALGGHSLLATRVIARLRSRLGVELPVRALFASPTIAGLAEQVEKAQAERQAWPEAPVRLDPQAEAPLSFAQQRLWFLDQLSPGSPAYNLSSALRLSGPLDRAALGASLTEIVARHDSLRTTFGIGRKGRQGQEGQYEDLVQRIGPAWAVPVPVVDLSRLPAPEPEARRLASEEAMRPFDLAAGPLLRCALLRLEPGEHLFLFSMHHIVSDGWSVGLLVGEVAGLYPAFANGLSSPLPPLPLQYADYARWQRGRLQGEALETRLAFWRERLAGVPVALELPSDRPRPPLPSGRGGVRSFQVPPDLTAALAALARREGATPFMVLLTAFEAFLGRSSGETDFLVGAPVANREHTEIENLIGCFINTVVLRADLGSERLSFRDLVGRGKEESLSAFAHQDLPFERLVEELAPERSLAHAPLFQVMFILQNTPPAALEVPGLSIEPLDGEGGTAKFDLTLALTETGPELAGALEYSRDLFDAPTAIRMTECFLTLLAGAVADPELPLVNLPLLADPERHQLLTEWNATAVAYEAADLCLHELFEAQAARTPKAVALEFEGGSWTYAELEARANQLADRLRSLGVRADRRVGLCAERSPEMVLGILATWKAGGAWVPLDPSYPAGRLGFLLEDAEASSLLVQEVDLEASEAWRCQVPVVVIDGESEAHSYLARGGDVPFEASPPNPLSLTGEGEIDFSPLPAHRSPSPVRERGPGGEASKGTSPPLARAHATGLSLAYILYTSGSTGTPKGVMVPHRGVVNRLLWGQSTYTLKPGDAVLHKAPFSFDFAVWECFAPLLAGARVVLAHPDGHRDFAYLARMIAERSITHAHFVPSMLRPFLEEDLEGCVSLRQVFTGGEALGPDLRDRYLASPLGRRGVPLDNPYGPTEASIDLTRWVCAPGARVPIGRPIANVRLIVADRELWPAPIGAPGELWIGGVPLARGYLGRPDRTAESFVPDPFGESGERLYRTGDLARWLPDGNLELLGRIDRQVKIRGVRIEPGEIEAALASAPEVAEAAVAVLEPGTAAARLAAWVVPRGEQADRESLRRHLRSRLPEILVPASIAFVQALPRTTSGKLDRKALAGLSPSEPTPSTGRGPQTPTEEVLAAIWSEVLGVEPILRNSDFFGLGGHSLIATQVVSRVRRTFGVELPLRQVFEAPSLGEMARRIDAAQRSAEEPPLVAVPRAGSLPLSFAQERLWFLDRLVPGRPTYNLAVALLIEGCLDSIALSRALAAVALRHEALRTTLREEEGGPVQKISDRPPTVLSLVDLTALESREIEAGKLAAEEAARPFDLGRGPLLRARLLRLEAEQHVLLLTLHHIVSDGWSMGVLVRETVELYAAFAEGREPVLPPLPVQYADYAVWQRQWLAGEVLARQLNFWKTHLADAPAVLDLPADRPRPAVLDPRGAYETFLLPADTARALRGQARARSATIFMALLAGFAAVLERWSGSEDIVVGTPVANRGRPEIERLIGFFVNTLALRTDLSGDPTFEDLLGRTRNAALGAYAHQDLPFEKLVEELHPERSLAYTPLFQAMLSLQNTPVARTELPGLTLEPLPLEIRTANFDLSLNLAEAEDGAVAGVLVYRTSLVDRSTVRRLLGHLGIFLTAAAAKPDLRISDLPLLREGERHQVLVGWNEMRVEKGKIASVLQLFEAQVARAPDALAIIAREETLTFAELDARAEALAERLRELGVGPEVRVGLEAGRSAELLVGLLGIWKAGGAWVPLDPSFPQERLDFQVRDAGVVAVVTGETLTPVPSPIRTHAHPGEGRPHPNEHFSPSPGGRECGWERGPGGEGLSAYILYTSGSTGEPKGVVVEHAALASYLAWVGECLIGESLPAVTRLTFDASLKQLLAPLLDGRPVRLLPEESLEPTALLRELAAGGYDTFNSVPSLWAALLELLEAGEEPRPGSLRRLLLGGEALPPDLLARTAAILPELEIWNLYGPTEATANATATRIVAGELITLGRPIAGLRAYVLDRHGNPVPLGATGELYLAGAGLSRGYLGRPSLTAERFLPDPFSDLPGGRIYRTGDRVRALADGRLVFHGRTDHQVKIRGFRVELGEVEAALRAHPSVRDAAVGVREVAPGDVRLVGFIVPHGKPADLRDDLRQSLPAQMIPAELIALEDLPRTATGKLDRRALAGLQSSPQERPYTAPRDAIERDLAAIWEELLGLERIGLQDNFFALGGHSLLATRLASRVRRDLGVMLPVRTLFETADLEELAKEVLVRRLDEKDRREVAEMMAELETLSEDEALALLDVPSTGDWHTEEERA